MAGVVAGYDLNLVDVSADVPRDAPRDESRAILLDGSERCFPDGAEGTGDDTPAHAIARSLYLRPLQRIHAAYGRNVVTLLESASLKARPLTVMDPVLKDVNYHSATLEPAKVKAAIAKLGWRGEEAEVDSEPAGSLPDMSDEVRAALAGVIVPYDEALRIYLGPRDATRVMKTWTSTKLAKAAAKAGAGAAAEEA